MKKIILLLAVVSLAACSKDDDGSSKKLVPTTITMVGDADSGFSGTINLTYDSQRRISSLVFVDDAATATIHYANDTQVSEIDYTASGVTNVATLTYDSQGRISALTNDDGSNPVVYSDDGSFTLQGILFAYNSAGDFSKFLNNTFAYDNGKKGAFANVSAFSPLVMAMMDSRVFFYASRKPLKTISADDSVIDSLENTYDSKGYIQHSVITGAEDATVSFEYESL